MKKHLFIILIGAASMVTGSPARAQNIVATHDAYGHTVWVASDEVKSPSEPQTAVPHTAAPQAVVPQTVVPQNQETRQTATSAQPASPSAAEATPSRYSGLVYWSNKEHRWVAVPLASFSGIRSVQKVFGLQ